MPRTIKWMMACVSRRRRTHGDHGGVSGQIFLGAPPPRDRGGRQPTTKNGEWPHYNGDIRGTRYSPLDQINAVELQQARSRLALQDRQPRPASRIQARRHADHGEGRAVHDRRHAPLGHRARRQDRRTASGRTACAKASARRCRRGSCPAAASRTGPTARGDDRVIYFTTGYRLSSSTRRPAADDQLVRHQRRRRSEARRRLRQPPADRSGDRRDRRPLDAGRRRATSSSSARRSAKAQTVVDAQQHQGAGPRVRCRAPARLLWTFNTIPRPGRVRQRNVGERFVGGQRQHRRVDADHRRRRSRAGLSAGRNADVRLLRRPSPRQQSVRRNARRASI